MSGIIDAHLHLSEMKDDYLIRYANFNGLKYTLDELIGLMEQYGVELGLLLSPLFKDGTAIPNSKIVELCQKSRGKLYPIITVEPSPEEVAACLTMAEDNQHYVKGFKIRLGYVKAYPSDRVFGPLYDYAESRDLPVMFHTGDTATSKGSLIHSHPLTLDSLANEREELKIVVCHFGNPWIIDVAELIYKHPNVYADISGLVAGDGGGYSSHYLDSLAAKISDAIFFAGGSDKIIFGTDYPVETFSAGLALVHKLKIEKEDIDKILSGNARRVFFSNVKL